METAFWTASTIHYTALAGAIMIEPAMILVCFAMMAVIPSLTETELIPGLGDSLEAQIEILKTQFYLNKAGYYE